MTAPEPQEVIAPSGGLAWEAGPERRGMRGAASTIYAILFDPAGAFAHTRLSGELWAAFSFYLGLMLLAAAISFLLDRISHSAMLPAYDRIFMILEPYYPPEVIERLRRAFMSVQSTSLLWFLSWRFIGFTLYIFASSAAAHICLMLVGAARGGFEATFKAFAYTHGATALLLAIPFCGPLLQIVWLSSVLVTALVQWHGASTFRVVAGLSLPLLPLACGAGALIFLLMIEMSRLTAGG